MKRVSKKINDHLFYDILFLWFSHILLSLGYCATSKFVLMNHRFVILFLFLLSLFSCKKSGNGIIETFSLELISSTPTNNETDVSIYTKEIVLIFNENVTIKSEYEITLNGITLNDVRPGIRKDLKLFCLLIWNRKLYIH